MDIKGCGKRNETLTFFVLPKEPTSVRPVVGLACGQKAERGDSRGVLLCGACAELHGFQIFTKKIKR